MPGMGFGTKGTQCGRGKCIKPSQTARTAKANQKAYLCLEIEGIRANTEARSSWKPPRQNAVKINIDFAMDDGNRIHGFGIVIRDGRGSFLAAKSSQGQGSLHPEHGKLMAIKEGLLFAMELGYRRICLESDSQVSINKILDKAPNYSHNGSILLDILSFAESFVILDCCFVPLRLNYVADTLANFALLSGSSIWTDSPPDFLENVLLVDLCSINTKLP